MVIPESRCVMMNRRSPTIIYQKWTYIPTLVGGIPNFGHSREKDISRHWSEEYPMLGHSAKEDIYRHWSEEYPNVGAFNERRYKPTLVGRVPQFWGQQKKIYPDIGRQNIPIFGKSSDNIIATTTPFKMKMRSRLGLNNPPVHRIFKFIIPSFGHHA